MTWFKENSQKRKVILISLGLVVSFLLVACNSSDSSKGQWTTGAPALTRRSEVAVATVGNLFYVIGGFERSTENIVTSQKVEIYDPQTDKWVSKMPLPVAVHHAGAVGLNGQLYVVGGFSPSQSNSWAPVNTLYRYDPREDEWIALRAMPTARGALAVTVIHEKIYAIGGYDGNRNPEATEVYDPQTDTWNSVAPIPTPRDHLAVVSIGHRLYAIGGRIRQNYNKNLGKVEVYDSLVDTWTTEPDLPTPRSGNTAAVLRDQIYVLGGESGEGTYSENERYDIQKGGWETLAPLPTARHGLGSAVFKGRIYVMSGGKVPGGTVSNINEIFMPPATLTP
jgi:N-acetylneuraminic acid mutarotase